MYVTVFISTMKSTVLEAICDEMRKKRDEWSGYMGDEQLNLQLNHTRIVSKLNKDRRKRGGEIS
jgi:hypothetical protein